jgi:hypothetical protein
VLSSELRAPAAVTFAVVVPLVTCLATAPVAAAEDGCGVGMAYSYVTQQCEPWAPVGVNGLYDPGIPVPIPNFNVVPNINVGLPGVNVGLPGVDLPRVDPGLRAVDAPIRAPIQDVPHNIPIHGGGGRR